MVKWLMDFAKKFLDDISFSESQNKLMMASWHGGMSIAFSSWYCPRFKLWVIICFGY